MENKSRVLSSRGRAAVSVCKINAPEVELALVRLYRLTGEKRVLRLAQYFVDSRGEKPSIFERQYDQLPERRVDLLGHSMSIKDFYRRFFLVNPSKFDTSYSQD
jgi:DUF1680 family protein